MAQLAPVPVPTYPRPSDETCTIEVAASRLGISLSKAYELAREEGRLHEGVPVLRFGRKMSVPVRAIDRVLMVEPPYTTEPLAS